MKKSTESPRGWFMPAVAALVALVLLLSGAIALKSFLARKKLEDSFSALTRTYPSLIVERVRFSKYLARGTLPGNDPHFSFLDVFLVRGTADIQFDLSRFAFDRERTNFLSRTLALRYTGTQAFVIDADISIDPSGITLAESIDPAPFTVGERTAVKDFLAVPAGAAGALIGGTAGAAAGSSDILPFMKYSGGFGSILGGAAGALAGGAAGTGAVYLFTDNFLSAIQPRANARLSVMEMIAAAKPLIGMELVCESRAGSSDWRHDVSEYYRAEFVSRMNSVARNFGWNRVIIDFGGGTL